MKKINIVFLIAVFLFTLTSCNKTPEEMILGTWKVSDFESTAGFDDDELKNLKDDLIKNEKYNFSADKLIISYEDVNTDWVWKINDKVDNLSLKSTDDGEIKNYEIVELSSQKMILKENVFDEHTETRTLKKAGNK